MLTLPDGLARTLALLCLACLFVACSPDPTEGERLAPGERLRAPVEPVAGPTEENPTVTLQVKVSDAETEQPVAATIMVDGRIIETDTTELQLRLPGRLRDRRVPIVISALGYKEWGTTVNWNVNHSRILEAPIRLNKLAPVK